MHQLEPAGEPVPLRRVEVRQRGLEVGLVLLQLRVLGLEEEDDLWPAVRGCRRPSTRSPRRTAAGCARRAGRPRCHRRTGRGRGRASSRRSPGRAPRSGASRPGPRAHLGDRREGSAPRGLDHVDLEAGERGDELVERPRGDRDLEILVLPPLPAEEEVDPPAGDDAPRRLHAGEPVGDLLGPPRVPAVRVELGAAGATPTRSCRAASTSGRAPRGSRPGSR